jgi:hypothetical protein
LVGQRLQGQPRSAKHFCRWLRLGWRPLTCGRLCMELNQPLTRRAAPSVDSADTNWATYIIPFAFAWTYEGAESHPLVLAIRRPFRVQWNAIPDLLSRASGSNNARRSARSPRTYYSSALHAPLPDDPMQAGNLAGIVEVRLFKTEHSQRPTKPRPECVSASSP